MSAALEKKTKAIADAKQPYERVVVTKEECEQLFASNPFKLAMIKGKLPDGSSTTVYRCGPFVDLCKGPHLPTTGRVKAVAVTKTSSSLWLGKQGNDELQRAPRDARRRSARERPHVPVWGRGRAPEPPTRVRVHHSAWHTWAA